MFYSVRLGGREIPTYALCMCLGMVLSAWVATRLAKKREGVDAFGVIALVAMTPLIAIQVLGLVYRIRSAKQKPMEEATVEEEILEEVPMMLDDESEDVIDL